SFHEIVACRRRTPDVERAFPRGLRVLDDQIAAAAPRGAAKIREDRLEPLHIDLVQSQTSYAEAAVSGWAHPTRHRGALLGPACRTTRRAACEGRSRRRS